MYYSILCIVIVTILHYTGVYQRMTLFALSNVMLHYRFLKAEMQYALLEAY